MTPEEELRNAGEANQILRSPMFEQARGNLVAQLAQMRRQVPVTESIMHTRLILMEQLMGYFFDYFEQIALTGRFAEIKLEEDAKRRTLMEQGIAMFRKMGRNA